MLIPQTSYRVFSGLPPKTHWAPTGYSCRGPRTRDTPPTRKCPDTREAPVPLRYRGFLYVWCGGVLLSHTLSGAVPSPCQALASGFGMGPGVSPGPWPPQIFSYTVRRWGLPACGGLGTGQRTRICRCFVLWPDNAHCRLVPFAGGRCGPTARGWNVSVAFRPLVPVGSTPRGASTSGLSTTCSAWGLQELEGSTECLSWSRLPA